MRRTRHEPDSPSTDGRKRTAVLRGLLMLFSELGLAVVISLGFFLVVMVVLRLAFPEGTGLAELLDAGFLDSSRQRARPAFDAANDAGDTTLARLSYTERRVLDRPGAAVLWNDSVTGMGIGNRHTVRTLQRSAAGIRFDDGTNLNLEEETLVVVRRFGGTAARRSSASFVLLDGDMHGSLATPRTGVEPPEIVTGSGTARIAPTSREPAGFALSIDDDGASNFSVRSGALEVSAGGKSTIVSANQVLTVRPDESFDGPRALPDAPVLDTPVDGASVTYGQIYPKIRFSWKASARARSYRLTIASDRAFDDVVYEQDATSEALTHGNLEQGQYYWRVTPVAGMPGHPSVTRRLRIDRDDTPPEVAVVMDDRVHDPEVVVVGTTEPGCRVTVGGKSFEVGQNGRFEHRLRLARGPNLVVVEVSDQAGNVSYHSQYVTATY